MIEGTTPTVGTSAYKYRMFNRRPLPEVQSVPNVFRFLLKKSKVSPYIYIYCISMNIMKLETTMECTREPFFNI